MKFNDKFSILKIIFLVILMLQLKSVTASHAVGADLTYTCIDPVARIYEVQLSFYRDCYGIDPSSSVEIHFESTSCNYSGVQYADQIPGTGQEVSPVCLSAQTTCSGGVNPGIEEYVYRTTITLPSNCTDWKFWYRVGNRNALINTIDAPDSEYLYVEAELDNSTYSKNNSPTFTNKPVPFICLGQNFCFNHGATDEDGDSLVYSLVSPLSHQNVPVNYLWGYSAGSPLNTIGPMTFDSETGSFCVTPANIEVTVMAVRVEEYRNGNRIGSVIRDMQIIVRSCSNELPDINGINGTDVYEDTICAYQPYCFDINSFDADGSQSVTLTWNEGIDGATFSPGSGSRPVAEFCWTPTSADIQSRPHYFTVTVRDDNCTYNGLQTYAFKIFVQELTVDAGKDTLVNCGTNAFLSASYNGSPSATYSWNNGMSGKDITVNEIGEYIVTVEDNGCAGQDTVYVNALNSPTIDLSPNDSILCSEEKTITASITPSNLTINWSTGETGNSIKVDTPNWYYASVTRDGCTATDSTNIKTVPFGWDINLAYSYGCEGDSTYFSNRNSVTSTGSSFATEWTIEGNKIAKDSTKYLFKALGSYPVRVDLTSIEGCEFDTTFNVDVLPKPIVEFEIDSGCINEQLIFSDITKGSPIQNLWQFGDGTGSINALIATHTYTSTGTFPVTLIVQDQNGCIDSLVQNTVINPTPVVDFNLTDVCTFDTVHLDASTNLPTYSYIWDDLSGNSKLGSGNFTIFQTSGSKMIELKIVDQLGCSDSLTKSVNILSKPTVSLSGIEVCEDQKVIFSTSSSGTNSVTWDFGDGSTSNLYSAEKSYNKDGNYIIDLIIEASNGCINNDTAIVKVHEVPNTSISPLVFCQEESIDLYNLLKSPNTDNTYQWQIDADITNGLHGKYAFQNPENNLVQVTETTPFGCVNSDTTTVFVNEIPIVDFSADTLYGCNPLTVKFTEEALTTTGAITNWNWGITTIEDGNSSIVNSIFDQAGIFDVTLEITDTNNCKAYKTKPNYIEIIGSPIADFNFSKNPINEVDNLTFLNNTSINGTGYVWRYGNNEISYQEEFSLTFDTVGTYPVQLIVSNHLGCSDTLSKNLILNPKYNFWIPKAFTPNKDGKNDYFVGQGVNFQNIEIWVYNRWGQLTYHNSGISFSWDGTYLNDGDKCQQDVYVYKAIVTSWNNKKHEYNGTVTLLR